MRSEELEGGKAGNSEKAGDSKRLDEDKDEDDEDDDDEDDDDEDDDWGLGTVRSSGLEATLLKLPWRLQLMWQQL
jgi:hypothetical protein